MRIRQVALVAGVIGLSGALAAGAAQDRHWPRWRGPSATGVAALNCDPPLEWSETNNIRWKVDIPGRGHATPIIWGDRIYIQTAVSSGGAAEPADEGDGADAPDRRMRRGGPQDAQPGEARRRHPAGWNPMEPAG